MPVIFWRKITYLVNNKKEISDKWLNHHLDELW